MDIIPELHPHNMHMLVLRNTFGVNVLIYCGARVWNYIFDNNVSDCEIGLFNLSKIVLTY